MVSRVVAVGVSVFFVAACATVQMDAQDVEDTLADALSDAGIEHGAISVADAPIAGTWLVAVDVEGVAVPIVVERGSGRIRSIEIPDGVDIDQDQLDTLADHAGNPADQTARRQRAVILILVIIGTVTGILLWARRRRLREEGLSGHAAGL